MTFNHIDFYFEFLCSPKGCLHDNIVLCSNLDFILECLICYAKLIASSFLLSSVRAQMSQHHHAHSPEPSLLLILAPIFTTLTYLHNLWFFYHSD